MYLWDGVVNITEPDLYCHVPGLVAKTYTSVWEIVPITPVSTYVACGLQIETCHEQI